MYWGKMRWFVFRLALGHRVDQEPENADHRSWLRNHEGKRRARRARRRVAKREIANLHLPTRFLGPGEARSTPCQAEMGQPETAILHYCPISAAWRGKKMAFMEKPETANLHCTGSPFWWPGKTESVSARQEPGRTYWHNLKLRSSILQARCQEPGQLDSSCRWLRAQSASRRDSKVHVGGVS